LPLVAVSGASMSSSDDVSGSNGLSVSGPPVVSEVIEGSDELGDGGEVVMLVSGWPA
jgi:hypothetical protein